VHPCRSSSSSSSSSITTGVVTLSISRDPPQSNKVRDRFQVLSMPVPSNAAAQPLKEIVRAMMLMLLLRAASMLPADAGLTLPFGWLQWKAADPNQVIKQRLKCVLPLTRGGDEGDDTTMIDDADAASVLHQPTTDDADEHTNPIEASTSSSTAMNESLSFEPAIELAVPAVQPASTESLDLPDLDTLPSEVQTKFEDVCDSRRLHHAANSLRVCLAGAVSCYNGWRTSRPSAIEPRPSSSRSRTRSMDSQAYVVGCDRDRRRPLMLTHSCLRQYAFHVFAGERHV